MCGPIELITVKLYLKCIECECNIIMLETQNVSQNKAESNRERKLSIPPKASNLTKYLTLKAAYLSLQGNI